MTLSLGHTSAKVRSSTANLRAKRARAPLYELLGGKRRSRIPAYASLLQYYGNASLLEQVTARALHDGYTELKLHERTASALEAARRATGPSIPIMVDTNCAWLPSEAPAAIASMAEYKPHWIEEPLWPPEDGRALGLLSHSCGVALASGENASSAYALGRLVEERAVRYVQPSVIKLGLTAAWDIASQCLGTPVICAPQTAFFGPGYLASLHLLAAQQAEASLERLYVELAHVPYASTVPVEKGWVHVPDTPGLGADPEPDLAEGNFRH